MIFFATPRCAASRNATLCGEPLRHAMRRAVLRRYAALHIARHIADPQFNSRICLLLYSHGAASQFNAPLRCICRLPAPRRIAIQLKDLLCTTLRSVPPLRATRHAFPPRIAAQLNDLFVTSQRTPRFGSTRLRSLRVASLPRCSVPLNATICLLIFFSSLRFSALRFAPLCPATQRCAMRRDATICLLHRFAARLCSPRLASAHGIFPRFGAAQLNATICLLLRNELRTTTPRFATPLFTPLHFSTLCAVPQLNATICLSIYSAALLRSSPLGSASGSAPRLPATQLNDLFVNLFSRLRSASQLSALPCVTFFRFAMPRSATQRFVCQFIFKAAHRVTLHFSALPHCAPLIVSFQLNEL